MAFRQPTFHAPQRIYTATDEAPTQALQPQQQPQPLADLEEWILFSPGAASSTDRTYTTSTARTRTAGRSRISDFGSIDTAARSYGYDDNSEAVEDDEEGEDGELDSLDSHLHEFRTEPSVYNRQVGEQSRTVLPTHDGLGSFRVDQTAMGDDVQEHLYAFERFNPRRVKRRRESEMAGMEEDERAVEADRIRRIETWRLEQSRVLVDEIQRETRRRKQSMASERVVLLVDKEEEDVATLSNVDGVVEALDRDNEGFWNRITRRVIRDLMGIDDDLLSIIFGETLPEDDDLSTTPPATSPLDVPRSLIQINEYDQSSWEYRLLDRIACELGILVNQITDHPGAFSTYLQSQQIPIPYAGLPIIPETGRDQQQLQLQESQLTTSLTSSSAAEPHFQPTLPLPMTIPQSSTSLISPLGEDATPRPTNILSAPLTREEWERDLDLKMVFRFLRSRFTSKFRSSSSTTSRSTDFTTTGTSHLATASTADTAARAARVRQHHPLVSTHQPVRKRRTSMEKRTWKATVPAERVGLGARRGSSSCASERLGLSGNGWAKGRSGSSKHYWDFGPGSVGSGSLIVSGAGGMGSWGEV